MSRIIILDSTPLGLFLQGRKYQRAEECRHWIRLHHSAGNRLIVPEIIDYEVRRELLRIGRATAVAKLDRFLNAAPDRFLPLTTPALRLAAELWAKIRQQGMPTADRHALDIDVILAAQMLSAGFSAGHAIIATSNAAHLSRFAPSMEWSTV